MAEKGRNNASKRSSRSDRNLRNAIDDAIADALGESSKTVSDLDRELFNQMRGKFSNQVLGEAGKTISDRDREMVREMMPLKPRMPKPRIRPDVGAIERGNRAAKRTAQDLSRMEAGGLVGGQKKLDKNKDGKISGADFRMMEEGGEAKVKKRKKSKGNMCRGGGAALRGTKFSGVR
jgi:hypothetical protein